MARRSSIRRYGAARLTDYHPRTDEALKAAILLHSHVVASGCREWTGRTHESAGGNLYGMVYTASKDGQGIAERAHRVAYRLFVGPLADDDLVCHKCNNTICVEPDHLYKGTHQDNAYDAILAGRHGAVRKATR